MNEWFLSFPKPEEPSDFETLLRKSSPPQWMPSVFLLPVAGGLLLQHRLPGASNLRLHWLLHFRQVLHHLSHRILIPVRTQLCSGDKLLLLFSPQSCPTLCDPMDCSLPGFPVHHQLPELPQTQSIESLMPSNYLSSSVLPFSSCLQSFQASGSFPMSQLFSSGGQSIGIWLQHQSIGRTDFLYNWLAWSPCSPRDSQESSPTPQFKSINSLALSFLHSPTLTSVHDYWKNHSFD